MPQSSSPFSTLSPRVLAQVAAAALVASAGTAYGQCDPVTNYGGPNTMAVGSLPNGVGVGDANNDGNLDLATGNFFGGDGSLIIGNGDGTFAPAIQIPMVAVGDTSGVGVQDAAIGDFNGDGWGDLAFTVNSGDLGNPGLAIVMNDGAGNFPGLPTFISFATQPRGLALVDIDQDGTLDIIYSDRDLLTLFIARGNGDGTFTVDDTTLAAGGPTGVAVSDFNGDGWLDVACSLVFDGAVAIFLNDGAGNLAESSRVAADGPEGIAAGDFNNDGFADLVIPHLNGDEAQFFMNNGNGTFGAKQVINTGAGSLPIAVGSSDANGDGFDDIFLSEFLNAAVQVHLSNGDGTFAAPNSFPAGQRTRDIAFGDFNNDGADDLAAANGATAGTATVILNNCGGAAACTGDIADDFGNLGADGMVSFGDFLALLGLLGPCPGGAPGCTGDIADDFGNLGGDGMVSFGDFLALLGLLGPCP